MTDWHFGFTALRIAKLFAESTAEKHCCADISKQLAIPHQTTWNALQTMRDAQILIPEKEWISEGMPQRGAGARVFYRLSEQGLNMAVTALAAVNFQRSAIQPS